MATQLLPDPDTSVRMPKRGVDGFISSPLIKVLIGPACKRSQLHIHQSIITSRSKFFAGALSGGRWKNSDTKTIDLYEADPSLTFRSVAKYLEAVYTNRIEARNDPHHLASICCVYVVAEKLLKVQTRKLAVQALYDHICEPCADGVHYYPSKKCIRVVYEGTTSTKDPMRRLLVEIWCTIGDDQLKVEDVHRYPKEFLLELAVAALGKRHESDVQKPLSYDLEESFQLDE